MNFLFKVGTREDLASYLDNLKVLTAKHNAKRNCWQKRFSTYNLFITGIISIMILFYWIGTIVTANVLRSTLPVLFASILLNLLKPIIFRFLKRSYLADKGALNKRSPVGVLFIQINHFFPERVHFSHPEHKNLLFQLKKATELQKETDEFFLFLKLKENFKSETYSSTSPYELPFNMELLVTSGKDLYVINGGNGSDEPDSSVLRAIKKTSELYQAIFDDKKGAKNNGHEILEGIL